MLSGAFLGKATKTVLSTACPTGRLSLCKTLPRKLNGVFVGSELVDQLILSVNPTAALFPLLTIRYLTGKATSLYTVSGRLMETGDSSARSPVISFTGLSLLLTLLPFVSNSKTLLSVSVRT